MTGQMSDIFWYNGQEYSIVSINGDNLFHPPEHGLFPIGTCTACWRGYVARYAVAEGKLVLDRLEIQLGYWEERKFIPQVGPAINGIQPITQAERSALFNNRYLGMGLPIPFTGEVWLGQEFIRSLYVHMGFQAPWKYQKVLALAFAAGQLVSEKDISAEMEAERQRETENRAG